MIAEGVPGDLLPSDHELAERFGVSRMTARQATQRLTMEGALYRVTGVGTFVARPPIRRPVSVLTSFSEEMRSRGFEPHSRLLVAKVRKAATEEALALRLPPGVRVVNVRRVRLADETPIAVQNGVLPLACAPILEENLESGSLHEALRNIGRLPTYARGGLSAVAADVEHAALLGVRREHPLLLERLTVYDEHEEPVEYTETRYVGDRYEFDIKLGRMPESAHGSA